MEQQVEFKTSMRGFDKKDVLGYIYEQNKRMQQLQEELDRRTAEADQAIQGQQQLRAELEQRQRQWADFQQQHNEKMQLTEKLSKAAAAVEKELENCKGVIMQKDREVKAFAEKNRLLQAKVEDLEGKGKKYDELSAQIGKVIIEAKASAGEIIEKAKENAGQMTANALASSSGFLGEIENLKQCVQAMRETAQSVSGDLAARADGLEKLLVEASRRIQNNVIQPGNQQQQQEKPPEITFETIFGNDR